MAGVGGSVGGCRVKEVGSGGSGESGLMALFCLMEMTIFSRSSGEMCFSLRGPRDSSESSLRSSGRADVGQEWVARSRWLLDDAESKLDESSGTSSDAGVLRLDAGEQDKGNDRGWSGARQQKLSRLKMRQLMFSYRLPSSSMSEHFEKPVAEATVSGAVSKKKKKSGGISTLSYLTTAGGGG